MLDLLADPLRALLGPLVEAAADPEVSLLLASEPPGLQIVRRGIVRSVEGSLPAGALEQLAGLLVDDGAGDATQRVLHGRGSRGETIVLVRTSPAASPALAVHLGPPAHTTLAALVDVDLVPALALPLLRAALTGRRGLLLVAPPPALDGGLLAGLLHELAPGARLVALQGGLLPAPTPAGCLPVELAAADDDALLDGVLALRPDRVVAPWLEAGTARGYLRAAAGVAGSIARVAGVDASGGLARLLALACSGGLDLETARALCAAAVSLVVVVGQLPDQRLSVVEIAELLPLSDGGALRPLFVCQSALDDEAAVPVLVPTGVLPSFLPSLVPFGARLDPGLFDPARHGLRPPPLPPVPPRPPLVRAPGTPAAASALSPPALPSPPPPQRGLVDATHARTAPPPAAAPRPPDTDFDNDDPGWEVEIMDRSNHGRSAVELSADGPATPPVSLVGTAPGETSFEALLRAKQEARGAAAAPRRQVPHPPPMHPLAQELGLEPPPATSPMPGVDDVDGEPPDDDV